MKLLIILIILIIFFMARMIYKQYKINMHYIKIIVCINNELSKNDNIEKIKNILKKEIEVLERSGIVEK